MELCLLHLNDCVILVTLNSFFSFFFFKITNMSEEYKLTLVSFVSTSHSTLDIMKDFMVMGYMLAS